MGLARVRGPEQHRHGRGVVEAVSLPVVGEAFDSAGVGAVHAADVGRVGEVGRVLEVVQERVGDVVRVAAGRLGEDRREQLLRVRAEGAGGDRRVVGRDVGGVVLRRRPEQVVADHVLLVEPQDARGDRVAVPGSGHVHPGEPAAGAREENVRGPVQERGRPRAQQQGVVVAVRADRHRDLPRQVGVGVLRGAGQQRHLGLHGHAGHTGLLPPPQGERVVGGRPPQELLRSGGHRRLEGDPGVPGPASRDPRAGPEADAPAGPQVAADREQPADRLANLDRLVVHAIPGAGQRRGGDLQGQDRGGDQRRHDEHRAAAEVDPGDLARITDPAPEPRRALVEGVHRDEQEQGRPGERDEVRQLLALGQSHVGHEDEAHHHDRVERAAVPEHGIGGELGGPPDEPAEHEHVVDFLGRERAAAPGDVEVCLHGPAGRPPERLPHWRTGQEGPAGQDRDEQAREQRSDQVRGPTAPADLGSDEPHGGAQQRAPDQPVGQVLPAVDPCRVIHGLGQDEDDQDHEADRQPALLGPAEATLVRQGHRARASARGRSGPRT